MRVIVTTDTAAVETLFERRDHVDVRKRRLVRAIVADVRARGDAALRRYAYRFDGLGGSARAAASAPLELPMDEVRACASTVPRRLAKAIVTAARHIRLVAASQVPATRTTVVAPGVRVTNRVTPLARVGCYAPGGRYPLPSTILMTAIPARVAGVAEVYAVCPKPTPAVCAAAVEAGVARLFRIGGAHAIAALAYGTESVPRVDKIVGPGNAYVATAKTLVAADCPIDFNAGPSEILVVATRGPARWIAADLIAQAEHDVDARAILVTTSAALARRVVRELEAATPADGPAREALRRHGTIVVARSRQEAIAVANRAAPEHLVCDDEVVADAITAAGAVFVGRWSAQVAGDYATGSNHVLPTNGAARFRGGLSAADFVRVSSVQRITEAGLRRLAPTILTLAEAEGLAAHAESIRVRL